MPWARRKFKGQVVWARVDAKGALVAEGGRVEMKYRLEDERSYRAAAANLAPDPGAPAAVPDGDAAESVFAESRKGAAAPAPAPPGSIVVYTDGACQGNPGPMGIGAVILDGGKRREIGEYLGMGTNNIAELTAIERALAAIDALEDRARPVLVHTDSSYAIGVLTSGWKAKANVELIDRMRRQLRAFPRLRMVKVPGHSGVPENERCDQLAREAISRRR